MAEKMSVVCDMHNKDHPATHLAVPVDMCEAAYARYQERLDGVVTRQGRFDKQQNEQDNEDLLHAIVVDPGQGRPLYAETLDWTPTRVSYATSRLRKRGLIKAHGKAQAAVWVPTAKGAKEEANG